MINQKIFVKQDTNESKAFSGVKKYSTRFSGGRNSGGRNGGGRGRRVSKKILYSMILQNL